ncbi:MAG: ATP-binding protein [Patescibacteria group bacterium]
MLYKRQISSELKKYIHSTEALILTGMRRVGKTTILKQLYSEIKSKNKAFFDFENTLDIRKFESLDYNRIWDNLAENGISKDEKAYIFIDEIQNFPKISSIAKYFIDHYQTKFFFTGSSTYYLKNLFPESMSGRKYTFEVFPLTFTEFLNFKGAEAPKQVNFFTHNKLLPLYKEYIEWGGFPGVVTENDTKEKTFKLRDIFKSYFEQDVKSLSDFKNYSLLRELIILLSKQTGSKTDISKLANILSTTRETIYSYLNFLEATYFISLLPPFSKNNFRASAGSKKVYLCDSGMANFLGKPSEGQLFEQSVFQNLRVNHELAYFDKGRRNEIDFVIDKKEALEVKLNASKRDIYNLKIRSEILKITDYKVATLNFSEEEKTIPALNLV